MPTGPLALVQPGHSRGPGVHAGMSTDHSAVSLTALPVAVFPASPTWASSEAETMSWCCPGSEPIAEIVVPQRSEPGKAI